MKQFFLTLCLTFNCILGFNQVPEKPEYNSYVYDYANVLTSEQGLALRHLLYLFDSTTTNQVVLIVMNDLNGNSIENFSAEVGETWGIGLSGIDNGILITTSIYDQKIRVEVGYGLEHIITDYWSSQHIREDAVPYFKTENYFEGLYNLTQNLIVEIEPNFIFPVLDENVGVVPIVKHEIHNKPDPFTNIIDGADTLNHELKQEVENYLVELNEEYNIPIYFYLFHNDKLPANDIFEFAYDVMDTWGFPVLYNNEEDKEDGVLVIYNIYNNSASCIVGDSYSSSLSSTYSIIDTNLTVESSTLPDRIKQTAFILASSYHDGYMSFVYIIGGTILGLFLLIFLIVKFGGKSSGGYSSGTFGGSGYSSSNSSSYSSGSSSSGSFGGGSFGGGGATGSW